MEFIVNYISNNLVGQLFTNLIGFSIAFLK